MTEKIKTNKKPRRYWSLRVILSWQFILVALLPLITVGTIHIQQMDTAIQADAEEKHRLLARSITSQVDLFFKRPISILYGVLPDIDTNALGDARLLAKTLDDHLTHTDLVESILLLDPSGRAHAVGLPSQRRPYRNSYYGLEYGHHAFIQQAHQQQKPVWSQTFLSPVSGEIIVSLAIPLNEWTLLGEVNLHRLSNHILGLSTADDILTIIIDNSGNVLVHPDPDRSRQQINLRNLPLVQQWLQGQELTSRFQFDGIDYFGSIATIPDLNWGAIVAQPSQHIFRMSGYTRTLFLVGALLSFSLAVFVALLLARRFSNRVDAFVRTVGQIAAGEYTTKIPHPHDTEFLTLSKAFLQMRASIAEREQQLAQSERMYREVVENSRDLITRVDTSGHIVYINHAAHEVYGLPPEECIGLSALDFIHPDDQAATQRAFQGWIEGATNHATWENRQVSRDGSTRLMSWTISILRDSEGEIEEFSSIARDITENRRSHEERLALETKLRQAQKMESVGHLAGGIAHDFNNILSAILGYTELAELHNQKLHDPDLTKYHARIKEGGLRARDLVAQLLTYARTGEAEEDHIHIAPVVKEVGKLLQSTFPTSLSLQWQVEDDLPEVAISPINLHQMLMNLAINARHAMAEKGEILIRAEHVHDAAQQECTSCLKGFAGDFVVIRVKDSGQGIDPNKLGQIFDPFYTTKERSKGTGLGLSMIHGIVHDAQGHIHVRSELGQGSEFSIYLPPTSSDDDTPSVQEHIDKQGQQEPLQLRVLLVDDEPAIIDFVSEALILRGCQVESFNDPRAGLARFKQQPDDFDLLITDQTMPEITGDELAQACLALRPQLPIILCSGYSSVLDAEKALTLGIRRYLMKPIRLNELYEAITQVVETPTPAPASDPTQSHQGAQP